MGRPNGCKKAVSGLILRIAVCESLRASAVWDRPSPVKMNISAAGGKRERVSVVEGK